MNVFPENCPCGMWHENDERCCPSAVIVIDGCFQHDCFADWNRCTSHDVPHCWDAGVFGGAIEPYVCTTRFARQVYPR